MVDEARGHESKDKFPDVTYLANEPRLASQIDLRRRRLLRLQASLPPPATWVVDRLAALELAVEALSKGPRRTGAAEAAWIAVHQVRHALCLHDDRPSLIEIAHQVQADLVDYGVPAQSLPVDVQGLITALVQGRGEPTAAQRNELYALSIIAATRREAGWNRVNHLVSRRFRAAITVVAVLLILVIVLPIGFEHISVGQGIAAFVYSWAREAGCIVAVLSCGALGALLSVLLGHERLQISSVEHHIVVATHRLRPVVGAASALVFFILWESGILQMADAGQRKPGIISGTLLVMALASGFSERLLLGQIEKLSAALQSTPAPSGGGGGNGRSALLSGLDAPSEAGPSRGELLSARESPPPPAKPLAFAVNNNETAPPKPGAPPAPNEKKEA